MARNLRLSLKLPSTGDTARVRSEPWHAVEIRSGSCACEAANSAAGTRYLATKAPLLPLADCDRRDQCECRYRHYADRRAGPRRKVEGAPPTSPATQARDRRNVESRRDEDRAAFEDPAEESPSLLEDTYYEYASKLRK